LTRPDQHPRLMHDRPSDHGKTAQLEEASKSVLGIAKSLERISQTASRWRKALLLSQILSTLGWAFF
jgi:hypothetical protein